MANIQQHDIIYHRLENYSFQAMFMYTGFPYHNLYTTIITPSGDFAPQINYSLTSLSQKCKPLSVLAV